ncbi:SPFH domain-containing protein [Alicyclobacillus macrosporangiidus]|uniref:Regulator of protease activity HflC, stomatin/prohibitin superfamily n=1 Tax=Alicyclobacillus macrosporangiidus TaxID=392015 RepID=A0A1I7L5M5_9BACL|nr:SPFH domain-containing protein [Alicyclobacillus macrosporangiidus]SFV04935.1 Regulator of protease activity HflC, stomatin/prohibitin superfamily [Alicyclobacillus macrosporangiidus]
MNERRTWKLNGYVGVLLFVLLLVGGVWQLLMRHVLLAVVLWLIAVVLVSGVFVVQPNQAVAVVLFGTYLGSVRESGLWITVPFTWRRKVSLRVRNFNSAKLKVNDVRGNPVEIAAVVVFRVIDSAKALFDVEDYEKFVEIQSETALRHVASRYPYDTYQTGELSLRANPEEVAGELVRELEERLKVAGVEVLEARLTHLAYAPEIASAMLQRQQAEAIVAARERIVEGAVTMVQAAIRQLEKERFVELDEERKANMVNNLLVAITSDRAAAPVINTGSLY